MHSRPLAAGARPLAAHAKPLAVGYAGVMDTVVVPGEAQVR